MQLARVKPSLDRLTTTTIGMMVLTSTVFTLRAIIRIRNPRQIAATDYILFVAYLFFLGLAALYLATMNAIYRWQKATIDPGQMYPDYLADLVIMRKAMLFGSYLLWCTLWAVKAAFLALYWKLVQTIPNFVRLWWIIVAFTTLAFLGNIPTHLMSCRKLDFFEPLGCQSPEDTVGQLISLYYSFAADIATDLAVMFLPLFVIRRSQIPRNKKIGIGVLFSIGWICIGVAIIRVIKVGEGKGQFIPGWLAMWGTIEAAIAVMVGCGPGLYVSAKEAYRSRSGRSYGTSNSGKAQAGSGSGGSDGRKRLAQGSSAKNSWHRVKDQNGDTEPVIDDIGDIGVQTKFELKEIRRRTSTTGEEEDNDTRLVRL